MYVDFMIRRRPRLEEDRPSLNARFVDQLMQVQGFWAPDKTAADAPVETDEDFASLDLRRALIAGLGGGQLRYCPRFAGWVNDDQAMNDDFLKFRMDTRKVDYAAFCGTILPKLIGIFRPYRLKVVSDDPVDTADWEISRVLFKETRRRSDGRDGVHRIWPVSYIDDLLCQRSFGITAEEAVDRVAPECERAELLHGGAFLIVTSEIVTGLAALDALNERVKGRLKHGSRIDRR